MIETFIVGLAGGAFFALLFGALIRLLGLAVIIVVNFAVYVRLGDLDADPAREMAAMNWAIFQWGLVLPLSAGLVIGGTSAWLIAAYLKDRVARRG